MNERDLRTGDQILQSVIAYCEWRAGDCWRRVSDPNHRWNEDRWHYLRAVRLLSELRYFEPVKAQRRKPVRAVAAVRQEMSA